MKVIISPNFETPLVEVTFLANHGHLDNPIGGAGYGQDLASNLFGSSKELMTDGGGGGDLSFEAWAKNNNIDLTKDAIGLGNDMKDSSK